MVQQQFRAVWSICCFFNLHGPFMQESVVSGQERNIFYTGRESRRRFILPDPVPVPLTHIVFSLSVNMNLIVPLFARFIPLLLAIVFFSQRTVLLLEFKRRKFR